MSINNVLGKNRWAFFGWYFGFPQCCIDKFIFDMHNIHGYGVWTRSQEQSDAASLLDNIGCVPCHSCAVKLINCEMTNDEYLADIQSRRKCNLPFHNRLSCRGDSHWLRIIRRLHSRNELPKNLLE